MQLPAICKIIEDDINMGKVWKLFVEDGTNGSEVLIGPKRKPIPLRVLPAVDHTQFKDWTILKEKVDDLRPFIKRVLTVQNINAMVARHVVIITAEQIIKTQAKHAQVLAFDVDEFREWMVEYTSKSSTNYLGL